MARRGSARGGRGGRRSPGRGASPAYPRSARLSETLREIIADELVRIDDERIELVTITSIDVDSELNRAYVYFDSLAGEDADDDIVAVLGEHRPRLQSSIARQMRAKKTPVLDFRPDDVLRSAERIDDILRADRERPRPADADADAPEPPDPPEPPHPPDPADPA